MKIIYESVEQRIRRASYEADVANKRIHRIDLTVSEANELAEQVRRTLYLSDPKEFTYYTKGDYGKSIGKYMGIDIHVEEKP